MIAETRPIIVAQPAPGKKQFRPVRKPLPDKGLTGFRGPLPDEVPHIFTFAELAPLRCQFDGYWAGVMQDWQQNL
jgi:hypothetical protein